MPIHEPAAASCCLVCMIATDTNSGQRYIVYHVGNDRYVATVYLIYKATKMYALCVEQEK